MAQIFCKLGDVFEGGAHLTVLPCSAKGTISSATRRWVDLFKIPVPQGKLLPPFGNISPLIPFKGPKRFTKFVVFASSVLNDQSSPECLENIARKLGAITKTNPSVRVIETPLLGTGAGGLPTAIAGKALSDGFVNAGVSSSHLFIRLFDKERLQTLADVLAGSQRGVKLANSTYPKVFISHSAKDESIAEALVGLLTTALGLKREEIRCTSVIGCKLPAGTHTSVQLREELRETKIVYGIVSPSSISSSYVLFELGASWCLGKPTFPLLSGKLSFKDLPGPLTERMAISLKKPADIHQVLKDSLRPLSLKGRLPNSRILNPKIRALAKLAR